MPPDDAAMDNAPPPPMCGTSAWLTYAHDGRRTSASDACISGPLTPSWTYVPMGTVKSMHHAIASTDAVYVDWASVSGTNLVLQDDGMYFVDTTTGKVGPNTGVDWWGQTIPAPNGGVWFVTTSKSDGPGLFVGLMDAMAKTVWKGNEQGAMC